ncbi:MAG TPA: hypothetical protein VLF71_00935 [Candidatus Saccharimonadales bacterium]|nr:hypothetical protein [Candidatus Saccharimonadales bacterium]
MQPNQPQTITTPPPEKPSNRRMWLLIGGAAAVVIIVIVILGRLGGKHATGSLIIKTDNAQNTINYEPSIVAGAKEGTATKLLKSGVAVRLAPGTYLVTVEDVRGDSMSRTVTVKPQATSTYTMNVANQSSPTEPVANVNAISFTVGDSALYFVNRQNESVYKIDGSNEVTKLSDLQFDGIHWADSTYGVGRDAGNGIYSIDNGVVSQITNVPSGTNAQTDISVTPDHYIYIVSGAKVYGGTPDKGFTRLYTAPKTPVSVFGANAQKFAVAYAPGEDSGKEPTLTVVQNGKQTAEAAIDGYEFAWSPDGKYLATTADLGSQVLDSSLKQVSIIARNNVNNLTWLGNNKLLYSVQNQVWEYSMGEANISQAVASAPLDHDISSIGVDQAHNNIYMSVQDSALSNDTFSIYRYTPPMTKTSVITPLQSQLPAVQGGCSYELVNFMGTPVVRYHAALPTEDCQYAATAYVRLFTVDPGQLRFEPTDTPLGGLAVLQTGTNPAGQN